MHTHSESSPSSKPHAETDKVFALQNRVGWMRALTMLGATICSFWLIYKVFAVNGFLLAFLAFVALSFAYRFGASPMLAIAASMLSLKYKAVGLWLPILTYVVGAILLYVDIRVGRLHQLLDPFNFRAAR